jgi:cation diffusion facilitator family transporter
VHRIRVGRRIGSAALVADGVHARTDGFTSLAVVVGALGVMLGLPLADPIIGILISAAILVLLVGTVRSISRRLMDGVEPELVDRARHALEHVDGIRGIDEIRLRWTGHRLRGDATVTVGDLPLSEADAIAAEARRQLEGHLPHVDDLRIVVRSRAGSA